MADGPKPADPIEEGVAGVQGGATEGNGDRPGRVTQTGSPGGVPDQPAPDGAEIEWAGGLVKKPPTPSA